MELASYVRPAVSIDVQEGKRPGYYAQFVKELASNARLYDRDKDLLIAENLDQLQDIRQVVERYHFPYEPMQLLELPENSDLGRYLDDYGFTARSDRTYMYADQIYAFRLFGGDVKQAELQVDEYMLAAIEREASSPTWIVPAEHCELMQGISRAYGCSLVAAL